MRKHILFTFLICLLLIVPSCDVNTENSSGIMLSNMDTTVSPSEDFFRYVNGNWLDKTVIPDDKSSWGAFNELREETNEKLLELVIHGVDQGEANSDEVKAVSFFKTIIDTIARNKLALNPIKPFLDKINNINSNKNLERILAEVSPNFDLGILGSYVYADAKDSNKNAVYLLEPELGLSDKEYYTSDLPDNKEKRELYRRQISKVFTSYFGDTPSEAESKSQRILKLETIMARHMLNRVELRDRRNTYHPMSFTNAQKLVPSFDLQDYFKIIGLPKLDSIVITQPKYMIALQNMLDTLPVEDWKAYMTWNLFCDSADLLSMDIEKTHWHFFQKTLRGVKKQRPLNKRALRVLNHTVGEALGRLYVKRNFPPKAKEKAIEMVSYLFKAYEKRIAQLSWMDEATKSNALKKLHKIRVKIGYPDHWKDYSQLIIIPPEKGGSYFNNMINYTTWQHKDNISRYGKPVDKDRWMMSPQTVNAYYNPPNNEIVFPAAILQPPFYNHKVDEAVNFGGIGAVIGHEISHGFDDSGARYDANGNLNDWWTKEDLKKFEKLGKNLVNQFSAIEPLSGVFIDGQFTLGENIGDLGGVNVALEALELYLKDNGNVGLIDNFTQEQRFFISWATVWRIKSREESIKRQLKTDPHSPGKYRAYMPLRNVDAFYTAFNIDSSSPMYIPPKDRVKIW